MVSGLDTIDWGSLTHAYGTAGDVPDQLRDLRSDDPEVVEAALEVLFSNIFHQGTRYQASAYAVPFLLDLAADPAVGRRHEVVYLLAGLAVGGGEEYVATGFPIAELREEVARLPEEAGQAWTRRLNEWMAAAEDDDATEFPLSEQEHHLLEARHSLPTRVCAATPARHEQFSVATLNPIKWELASRSRHRVRSYRS